MLKPAVLLKASHKSIYIKSNQNSNRKIDKIPEEKAQEYWNQLLNTNISNGKKVWDGKPRNFRLVFKIMTKYLEFNRIG